MIDRYPNSFVSTSAWAARNNVSITEARIRFAQYAILQAIAESRTLHALLVFKGGNALDFIWQPNRSTIDLDFSADLTPELPAIDSDILRPLFERGLGAVGRRLGILFAVHRIEQQPPGLNRTFITYEARIGYALPDEPRVRARLEQGRPSPLVIPVDISLNEPICAARTIDLDSNHRLRVSTLEDIVAEKLRALLQQPIRNRTRSQDLLDIAFILIHQPNLDRARVAEYLLRKAAARAVPVSRAAFHQPEVVRSAQQDYAALESTTRTLFIPLEDALAALFTFVDSLNIPDIGP